MNQSKGQPCSVHQSLAQHCCVAGVCIIQHALQHRDELDHARVDRFSFVQTGHMLLPQYIDERRDGIGDAFEELWYHVGFEDDEHILDPVQNARVTPRFEQPADDSVIYHRAIAKVWT